MAAAASTMVCLWFAGGAAAQSLPANAHMAIKCVNAAALCTEVANSDSVFGHYVGHDEPTMEFISTAPGSGNHMSYNIRLPHDPSAANPLTPGKSYQFELSGADWLGMAMCDTQSYPEQVSTCPPDSDANVLDPATSPKHVGEAYMEMQFYPPGWVPWPTWAQAVGASSCSATEWCAALNIDSLSLNPVTGQANNQTCLNKVGEEYVNFAFITHSGVSQAPANPVDSTVQTFTPDPRRDLFMHPGDDLQVSFTDTVNGLKVTIDDLTSGEAGSMTASPANGFAQIKFDPTGNSCQAIPYAFHPMYATSQPSTRVTWAAGAYNVGYDTEIGHFQVCRGPYAIPATPFGYDSFGNPTYCPGDNVESPPPALSPNDEDDYFCFPGSEALLDKVPGCTYTNTGFDGLSYQPDWPDGNATLHPAPVYFSSPETGRNYDQQYQRAAFEVDLPAVESNTCDRATGQGCTHIPTTDTGQPAAFYPFYTTSNHGPGGGCVWEMGNNIPGETNNFGQNAEYGPLHKADYTTTGGGTVVRYEDFQNILKTNPCPQTGTGGF